MSELEEQGSWAAEQCGGGTLGGKAENKKTQVSVRGVGRSSVNVAVCQFPSPPNVRTLKIEEFFGEEFCGISKGVQDSRAACACAEGFRSNCDAQVPCANVDGTRGVFVATLRLKSRHYLFLLAPCPVLISWVNG